MWTNLLASSSSLEYLLNKSPKLKGLAIDVSYIHSLAVLSSNENTFKLERIGLYDGRNSTEDKSSKLKKKKLLMRMINNLRENLKALSFDDCKFVKEEVLDCIGSSCPNFEEIGFFYSQYCKEKPFVPASVLLKLARDCPKFPSVLKIHLKTEIFSGSTTEIKQFCEKYFDRLRELFVRNSEQLSSNFGDLLSCNNERLEKLTLDIKLLFSWRDFSEKIRVLRQLRSLYVNFKSFPDILKNDFVEIKSSSIERMKALHSKIRVDCPNLVDLTYSPTHATPSFESLPPKLQYHTLKMSDSSELFNLPKFKFDTLSLGSGKIDEEIWQQ